MTITIDPKTGYSPELKARVEAEIARGKTFEPLAAAASQPPAAQKSYPEQSQLLHAL